MNQVQLIGRLVKDPEVKYSKADKPIAICNYTLAVNKDSKSDAVNFINCVALGQSGEFAKNHFIKGQQIGVVGSLEVSSWNENGTKRFKTEVKVEKQYFAGNKPANSN